MLTLPRESGEGKLLSAHQTGFAESPHTSALIRMGDQKPETSPRRAENPLSEVCCMALSRACS